MKIKSHAILTMMVVMASIVQGCGGGGGTADTSTGGPNNPVTQREATLGAPGGITASGFTFVSGSGPVIQFREITNGPIQDPNSDSTVYRPGDALPFEEGKIYLVTLRANDDPESRGTQYISNTRSSVGEECLLSAALTTRPCPATDGRVETMSADLAWRAVVNLKGETATSRRVFVTPITTLVAERARVLTTPRGGSLTIEEALKKAEEELRDSLMPQSQDPQQISLIEPKLESLSDDVNSRYGLLLGAMERLTQQMSRTVAQTEASVGYSAKYDILFASFARDGKFETLQENIQGNSVGLRSVGALLNAALTEHLVRDAPRYKSVTFTNFRSEDFLLSKGALALRQSLSNTYIDLMDSSNSALASIPYVAASENNQTQDHLITAVAARTAGIFFLDSRGEAQDGNKAAVQCSPADLGAPADFEFTGVVALDGAAIPTLLAFSHTDTRAFLIDVRKVGLDQANPGSDNACAIGAMKDATGFRQIDFRDAASQNAALYQNAAQYQHVSHNSNVGSKPVTLTSATFDSRLNKVLISTLDGVLAFDITPANTGSPTTGSMQITTRYRDFAAFPNNSSNVRIGLGMNPVFDNTAGVLWSPFDYSSGNRGNDDFRGLFGLDYSSTALPFSSNARPFRTANSADSFALINSALMGAYNQAHGVAAISGIYRVPDEAMQCRQVNQPATAPYNTVRLFDVSSANTFDRESGAINLSTSVDLEPVLGFRMVTETTDPEEPPPNLIGDLLSGLTGNMQPPPQPVTTVRKERCTVGYHGVAFENRLRDNKPTASTGLYAIAPVQPSREFEVPHGLVRSVLLASPRFEQNFNTDGRWRAALNSKRFVIFQQNNLDPRSLVADDIRSYGVLRLRGTFPKSLAYFLVSEPSNGTGSNNTRYSLIEADLEAISQIPDTESDASVGNSSYTVPTTRLGPGQAANPLRVYFR